MNKEYLKNRNKTKNRKLQRKKGGSNSRRVTNKRNVHFSNKHDIGIAQNNVKNSCFRPSVDRVLTPPYQHEDIDPDIEKKLQLAYQNRLLQTNFQDTDSIDTQDIIDYLLEEEENNFADDEDEAYEKKTKNKTNKRKRRKGGSGRRKTLRWEKSKLKKQEKEDTEKIKELYPETYNRIIEIDKNIRSMRKTREKDKKSLEDHYIKKGWTKEQYTRRRNEIKNKMAKEYNKSIITQKKDLPTIEEENDFNLNTIFNAESSGGGQIASSLYNNIFKKKKNESNFFRNSSQDLNILFVNHEDLELNKYYLIKLKEIDGDTNAYVNKKWKGRFLGYTVQEGQYNIFDLDKSQLSALFEVKEYINGSLNNTIEKKTLDVNDGYEYKIAPMQDFNDYTLIGMTNAIIKKNESIENTVNDNLSKRDSNNQLNQVWKDYNNKNE